MTAPGRARSASPWLLILCIALIGTVLRGPIVAVAPVIEAIRADFALTAGQAGLLTSIPVLCFALVTPIAVAVMKRMGADAAITLCLAGVVLGTLVRSADGIAAAIVGTVIIGAFITIGNVVVPVVIRRDFSAARVGIATGVYTAALNIGSTVTSIGTAPIAEAVGWQLALVAWVGFAVVALAAWFFVAGSRGVPRLRRIPRDIGGAPMVGGMDATADADPLPRVWRSLTVVMLTIAFCGQAFSYYGVTAWLPTILVDQNGFSVAEAGASSSLFQVGAVAGALGVPLLLSRLRPTGTFLVLGALWASVPIGLIVAPDLWALWCTLGGVAQGGGITVIFVLIVRIAGSDSHASRLSATVQGVGYAVAATSPTVLGFVHDISGSWTAPLLVVLVAVLAFVGLGFGAAFRRSRAA
ncbi:MFS transporter [Marisediminicola senii]|uniref:MFS transporter n=1 Tax=Marisediminicola senii TaxID=2711233 RepID=UPI0013ED9156|nr:MFS transporter [Marisediminicola senii]